MLRMDVEAFGGLGKHVKMQRAGTKSMDLHTGDAVINEEACGRFFHLRKVFTQDEMQAAVSLGVAEIKKHKPDWSVESYPELVAWLRYEAVSNITTETSPADAPAPAAVE